MQFSIQREALLTPLQFIAGVVERRQTLPILSNVLLKLKKQELSLVGTDLEVELLARIELEAAGDAGSTTVPARKLMDICRSLPEGAELEFNQEGNKLNIRSGRSRFNLATLPATDFPYAEEMPGQQEFVISQKELRNLIERTQFAMAQQDVRYYLNGMLWELGDGQFRAVATDGHRLALSSVTSETPGNMQVIVPRKAILELSRILTNDNDQAIVVLSANQLRVKTTDYIFTSKLIDGRFPDYDKVIPQNGDKFLIVDRDLLKQALTRVGVLANEKHRSVRLELNKNTLRIVTNNPEQEEAEEQLDVDYSGGALNIAFNINYLADALASLPQGMVKITMSNSDSSSRVEEVDGEESIYVIMPMRL